MTTPLFILTQLGGVARTARLRRAGATSADIRAALDSGALVRIRKGWVRTLDAAPDVVRAVSLGGRLGCVSAAKHLGLWTPDSADDTVHVARPRHAGRTFGDSAGCVEHWQSQTWSTREEAVESVDAVVRQVLLCLEREDAIAIIDSALNTRTLTPERLGRIVSSLPTRFARVLHEVDARGESGLETICRLRLSRLGVSVRSQVYLAGVGRVDLLLGERVILEADGKQWHRGEAAFSADRSRDLALLRRGFVVIRVAYHHVVHEWYLIESVIIGLIERGEHLWSAAHRRAGLAR